MGVLAFVPGRDDDQLELVRRWLDEQHGEARITGRNARNLNPIIRRGEAGPEAELAWWWLHVGGQPAKFTAFNSRSDRLLQSWREPFQHRALAPASWYVEKGVRFELPGGEPFGIAAITAPTADESFTSYSIVTREAVSDAARVHDRMPLVLPESLHDEWLDPARRGDASLVERAIRASEEVSGALVAAGPVAGPARGTSKTAPPDAQPTLF
ncbi:hypothetical protein GCM10010471_09570 [Leucobacter komagatae]